MTHQLQHSKTIEMWAITLDEMKNTYEPNLRFDCQQMVELLHDLAVRVREPHINIGET